MSSEFVLYSRKFVRNGLMGENDRLNLDLGQNIGSVFFFLLP